MPQIIKLVETIFIKSISNNNLLYVCEIRGTYFNITALNKCKIFQNITNSKQLNFVSRVYDLKS